MVPCCKICKYCYPLVMWVDLKEFGSSADGDKLYTISKEAPKPNYAKLLNCCILHVEEGGPVHQVPCISGICEGFQEKENLNV